MKCNSSEIWLRAWFCRGDRGREEMRMDREKERSIGGRGRENSSGNAQVQRRVGATRRRERKQQETWVEKTRGAYKITAKKKKKNMRDSKRAKLWVADYSLLICIGIPAPGRGDHKTASWKIGEGNGLLVLLLSTSQRRS